MMEHQTFYILVRTADGEPIHVFPNEATAKAHKAWCNQSSVLPEYTEIVKVVTVDDRSRSESS